METKKTTLMLDEGLYTQVKVRAAQRGVSASSVVAEALASYFSKGIPEKKKPIKLTVAQGGGWFGPTGTSNSEFFDAMDEDLPMDKLR